MIKLQGKLDKVVRLAVSGGLDSVAALDFLSRNHHVIILHVNHNEGNSDETADFVHDLATKYQCPLFYKKIDVEKSPNQSPEEFWRNERYKFFRELSTDIVTCHHLDDCVETWIWSSLHGQSRIIPYRNKNVIRPFRLTRRSDFVRWAEKNNLTWIEDQSNMNMKLQRNFIRHNLIDNCLVVNPGLHKTIARKVMQNEGNEDINSLRSYADTGD